MENIGASVSAVLTLKKQEADERDIENEKKNGIINIIKIK